MLQQSNNVSATKLLQRRHSVNDDCEQVRVDCFVSATRLQRQTVARQMRLRCRGARYSKKRRQSSRLVGLRQRRRQPHVGIR